MKKLLVLISLLAVGCVNSAFAWNFPTKEFSVATNKVGLSLGDVSAPVKDVFAAMPLMDGLYQFSTPNQAGNGGVGFFYAVGLFTVQQATVTDVSVQPLLFVGFGGNAYFANFLANNASGQVPIDLGLELGVPNIQGIGSFTIGYDLSTSKLTVGMAAPLDILSGSLIHVFSSL
jgi:hypothetical protein